MNYKQKYLSFKGYGEQDFIPCEVCGARAVDVHHILFRSHGGTDEVENIILLCRNCHNKAHNNIKFNENLKKLK